MFNQYFRANRNKDNAAKDICTFGHPLAEFGTEPNGRQAQCKCYQTDGRDRFEQADFQ